MNMGLERTIDPLQRVVIITGVAHKTDYRGKGTDSTSEIALTHTHTRLWSLSQSCLAGLTLKPQCTLGTMGR